MLASFVFSGLLDLSSCCARATPFGQYNVSMDDDDNYDYEENGDYNKLLF